MRAFASVAAACLLLLGCTQSKKESSESDIWKSPPHSVLTEAEMKAEIAEKMGRLQQFLTNENLNAILLTQVRNVYWMTAGAANIQIVLNKDVGAASLLITRDGKKYLVCNGSEAGRLVDETLKALGYELTMYPGIQETVQENQAFAWNPTITGTKVEDTIITFKDHIDVVTKADNWPMIPVDVNGKTYEQPDILIR